MRKRNRSPASAGPKFREDNESHRQGPGAYCRSQFGGQAPSWLSTASDGERLWVRMAAPPRIENTVFVRQIHCPCSHQGRHWACLPALRCAGNNDGLAAPSHYASVNKNPPTRLLGNAPVEVGLEFSQDVAEVKERAICLAPA